MASAAAFQGHFDQREYNECGASCVVLSSQVDKNGDGLIDYAEFCQMMLPSDALNQFHAAKFPRHRAARRVQLDTATVRADQRLPAVDAACA